MKRCLVLLLNAAFLFAAGCGSSPTRFYTLTPLSAPGHGNPAVAGRVNLGVGPVEFPQALDRPQIMTRRGANEFDLAEFDRWAEPLEDNFIQVFSENLSVLLPGKRISVYPWDRSTEIDYQVVARVLRFDQSMDGDAVLKVRWSIRSPVDEHEALVRESRYVKRMAGDDFRATVEALNQALNDFSRDVAGAVKGLRGRTP